jgi:hypothetical protein
MCQIEMSSLYRCSCFLVEHHFFQEFAETRIECQEDPDWNTPVKVEGDEATRAAQDVWDHL